MAAASCNIRAVGACSIKRFVVPAIHTMLARPSSPPGDQAAERARMTGGQEAGPDDPYEAQQDE